MALSTDHIYISIAISIKNRNIENTTKNVEAWKFGMKSE